MLYPSMLWFFNHSPQAIPIINIFVASLNGHLSPLSIMRQHWQHTSGRRKINLLRPLARGHSKEKTRGDICHSIGWYTHRVWCIIVPCGTASSTSEIKCSRIECSMKLLGFILIYPVLYHNAARILDYHTFGKKNTSRCLDDELSATLYIFQMLIVL